MRGTFYSRSRRSRTKEKKLGWDKDLTEAELVAINGANRINVAFRTVFSYR
jgi:hypothetical protein